MKYIKVKWNHVVGEEQEPVWLYSEIDESNWEVRKVEVFENGKLQFADGENHTGDTALGLEPLPSLEKINDQAEFHGIEISKNDFEELWEKAVALANEGN